MRWSHCDISWKCKLRNVKKFFRKHTHWRQNLDRFSLLWLGGNLIYAVLFYHTGQHIFAYLLPSLLPSSTRTLLDYIVFFILTFVSRMFKMTLYGTKCEIVGHFGITWDNKRMPPHFQSNMAGCGNNNTPLRLLHYKLIVVWVNRWPTMWSYLAEQLRVPDGAGLADLPRVIAIKIFVFLPAIRSTKQFWSTEIASRLFASSRYIFCVRNYCLRKILV